LQKAEAQISDMPTGFNIAVDVHVTFSSTDSFDMIKNWYTAHPDGGRYGLEVNTFPENGLDHIGDFTGETIYQVTYVSDDECGLLTSCVQTLHQIR
jgi:hypothetical protein